MLSVGAVALAALGGLVVWTLVGWAVAGRLVAADLRLAVAPALGWALHTALAHALAPFVGIAAAAGLAMAVLLAVGGPWRRAAGLPLWVVGLALCVAVLPVLGLLPKTGAAALADPIYDHAKIALVDEIVRAGVPPANPFFAAGGGEGAVAYYYLWHFGAAELALLSGASGWEADAAATVCTGFAALLLMAGLAVRLAGGRTAAAAVVLLSAVSDSGRVVLAAVADPAALRLAPGGLSNWLVQASWSPQHVASATAVVLALLVMPRLASAPSAGGAAALALLGAAAYGSSAWVGGAVFCAVAALAGAVLLVQAAPALRVRFVAAGAVAAGAALVLVLPLVVAQLRWAEARDGATMAFAPFRVFEGGAGPLADALGYWLVLLPLDLPFLFAGVAVAALGLVRLPLGGALSAGIVGSLVVAAFVASRSGENNDLGWRGILPAVLIATSVAAAALVRLVAERRLAAVPLALALAVALPGGATFMRRTVAGVPSAEAAAFAAAPAMWAAVRAHTAPDERVASNPLLAASLTPWPVNISWALLADRRSCYAGNELAIAFAPLPAAEREAANNLFARVFAGAGSAADLSRLVADFGCRTVLVTAADGAFTNDPFAASPLFARADERADRWRIYRAAAGR